MQIRSSAVWKLWKKWPRNWLQEAYKATDPKQQRSSEEPADFVNPANQEKKKDNKDDIIDADFTAKVNSGFPDDVPK